MQLEKQNSEREEGTSSITEIDNGFSTGQRKRLYRLNKEDDLNINEQPPKCIRREKSTTTYGRTSTTT